VEYVENAPITPMWTAIASQRSQWALAAAQ